MDACAAGPILGTSSLFVDVFAGRYVESCAGEEFFSSHCHTDHMQGLSGAWRLGKIHCSELSARLLSLKFGFTPDLQRVVRPHAVGEVLEVFNCRSRCVMDVTLIDSNHCPGSVMFLFEGGQKGQCYIQGTAVSTKACVLILCFAV